MFNKIVTLKLFQFAIDENVGLTSETEGDADISLNILKALLIENGELNSRDLIISQIITEKEKSNEYYDLLIAHIAYSLSQYELYATNPHQLIKIFICQLIKAIYLSEFLFSQNTKLLNAFLQKYECNNFNEYLRLYLPLLLNTINLIAQYGRVPYVDIKLRKEDQGIVNFIEKFIINTGVITEDIDYRVLRSSPIVKLGDHHYLVISQLFLIQKIYNGLYFELNLINDSLGELKEKNFRSYFTGSFSEKYLLYEIMYASFKERGYTLFCGDDIEYKFNFKGGPDFYIRDGNVIFLFENKDNFFESSAKANSSYNDVKDFIDKLFIKEKKGLPQLVRNIKTTLSNDQHPYDSNFSKHECKIYPIIITQKTEFDIPGLNIYVQKEFTKQLEKAKQEGFNINSVREVTLINIDIFIVWQNAFSSGKITLSDVLEEYHQFVKLNHTHNIEHKNGTTLPAYYSFSDYFWDVYWAQKNLDFGDEIERLLHKYKLDVLF